MDYVRGFWWRRENPSPSSHCVERACRCQRRTSLLPTLLSASAENGGRDPIQVHWSSLSDKCSHGAILGAIWYLIFFAPLEHLAIKLKASAAHLGSTSVAPDPHLITASFIPSSSCHAAMIRSSGSQQPAPVLTAPQLLRLLLQPNQLRLQDELQKASQTCNLNYSAGDCRELVWLNVIFVDCSCMLLRAAELQAGTVRERPDFNPVKSIAD